MKNEEKIRAVIEEAAKLLRDYPELKYYEAINKAKEVLKGEMGEFNQRLDTRGGN